MQFGKQEFIADTKAGYLQAQSFCVPLPIGKACAFASICRATSLHLSEFLSRLPKKISLALSGPTALTSSKSKQ